MTYWQFHLVFVLPALAIVTGLFVRQKSDRQQRRSQVFYVLLLAAIAFVYTTPWDNYLVKNEIWTYGADRVSHVIGYVPIEEYAFFLLQPLVTGLLYLVLRNASAPLGPIRRNPKIRAAGSAFLLAVVAVTLSLRGEPYTYLRLIVGWSVPVVAAQWLLGGDYFLQRFRTWMLGIWIPTIFFSFADGFAIANGIWDISSKTSTDLAIGVLPIEEFLFFLVTNILVVQGLMLFVPDPDNALTFRKISNQSR